MECKSEQNKKSCACTYSCSRRGVCCDCIAHHRKSAELPACYFPRDEESKYDRSIENFIRIVKERGTGFLE